jgi:hypothetical protein
MRVPLISFLCLLHSGLVQAGTFVEVKHENSLSTILSEGDKMRMSSSSSDYLIIDNSSKTIKAVNDAARKVVVIDMDSFPEPSSAAHVRVEFRNYGSGPQIAGFDTTRYEYMVNGRSCGFVYGSQSAMQADGIENMFSAMSTMIDSKRAMIGGFAALMDECKQADISLNEHVQRIGLPMRTERKGIIQTEVMTIRLNVPVPPESFIIPENYLAVSAIDEMQAVEKQRYDARRAPAEQMPPHMQDIMKQMQQSGQVPPQMRERMQRMPMRGGPDLPPR